MTKNTSKKLLAIETSCDETSAAVVEFGQKTPITGLSNVVSSQIKIHKKTAGVVPEVAARAHIQKIGPVVQKALKQAKIGLPDVDLVAVTVGPGLISSLLIGAEFAKSLAFALNKPLLPINHMLGHLYSAFLENPGLSLPSVNLIVSGGHTYLVLMKDRKTFVELGSTMDDAAGEAFDKVAKMLGLPYPGGPQISQYAQRGKHDYNLPRPMLNSGDFNFSFAGLKTAVLYLIRDKKLSIKSEQVKADVAMSFQNAAVDVLISKTMRAAKKYKARSITLSGGVAANKLLREKLSASAKKAGAKFYVPTFELCTDNALMIGNVAAIQIQSGAAKPIAPEKIRVNPVMELK